MSNGYEVEIDQTLQMASDFMRGCSTLPVAEGRFKEEERKKKTTLATTTAKLLGWSFLNHQMNKGAKDCNTQCWGEF